MSNDISEAYARFKTTIIGSGPRQESPSASNSCEELPFLDPSAPSMTSEKKTNNLLELDATRKNNNNNNVTVEMAELESPIKLTKKYLNIDGMSCGACSSAVTKLLNGLDGIESASVTLLLARGEVVFDESVISLSDIIDEIEELGFDASELVMTKQVADSFNVKLTFNSNNVNKNNIAIHVERFMNKIYKLTGVNNVSKSKDSGNNSKTNEGDDSSGDRSDSKKEHECILTIEFDSKVTNMRHIYETLNKIMYNTSQNELINVELSFDSSDITIRKRNLQALRKKEIEKWHSLLLFSLFFGAPALILTMICPMFNGFDQIFQTYIVPGCAIRDIVLFCFATPIQFGKPGMLFYRNAIKSLRAGNANMDVLVALATSVSYLFSLFTVIICVIERINHNQHTTFETSAVLITVIIIGKYMETVAKGRTSEALDKLMDLQPSQARLVQDYVAPSDDKDSNQQRSFQVRDIDSRLVAIGDVLEVERGMKCPVDGVIIEGASNFDESLITGESRPVKKSVDDQVIGATVNLTNTVYIRVNKTGSETVLSKIITLVENAQSSRAPVQQLADAISRKFVPFVILISLMVVVCWYVAFTMGWVDSKNLFETGNTLNDHHRGNHGSVFYSLMFGISVLVISCPCALGLATPTAVMVGTGKAAELGILFKGGEPLEQAGQTTCIIFDKTGTLTEGKMKVNNVIRVNDKMLSKIFITNTSEDESKDDSKNKDNDIGNTFWNYIYGTESQSEHLIAHAICTFIEKEIGTDHNENDKQNENNTEKKLHYWIPKEFNATTGKGVCATFNNGNEIKIGNWKYLCESELNCDYFYNTLRVMYGHEEEDNDDLNDKTEYIRSKIQLFEHSGDTCVYGAINNVLVAVIAIADKIKPDAGKVIAYLQNDLNISCYMLTGDDEGTAKAVGEQIGIPQSHVYAQLTPSDKQGIVKQLQNEKRLIFNEDQNRSKNCCDISSCWCSICMANESMQVLSGSQRLMYAKNIVTFVGDGVNDSPSLAQANVGIAIGAGTDVAIASAAIVLMKSEISDVLNVIDISKSVIKRIRYNFMWALGYNACMIPFAAGVFFPVFHYALPPYVAGLLMCLSSVSVVANSLYLKRYQPLTAILNENSNKFQVRQSNKLISIPDNDDEY